MLTGLTREGWLIKLARKFEKAFKKEGQKYPEKMRLSCGLPLTGAFSKVRTIGQCFYPSNSKDKSIEIFISPVEDDKFKVAGTLIHELCHAVLPLGSGHGTAFRDLAIKMGLTGKMKATTNSEGLTKALEIMFKKFPEYPHKSMLATVKLKKDTTRMFKVICDDCGYTVRISRKWMDKGCPTCPCGQSMERE